MAVDLLRDRPAPVLVLGMHRSGTSAVSRLLHRAGINMGRRQDANAESLFFLRMNRWLLTQCGASWAQVEPVAPILDQNADRLAPMIERRARSASALEHFGRSPRPTSWGFKDPRTAILFDVYHRVFPDARIVLVSRHGVDVAESLRVRAEASGRSIGTDRPAPVFGVRQPRSNRLQNALVASDLDRNFTLWMHYQRRLDEIEQIVDASRVHRLNFETLAQDPMSAATALGAFLGVSIAPPAMKADRSRAFSQVPQLVQFAESKRVELERFGY